MVISFLLLCLETPEIWKDVEEDDDEDLIMFYQLLMRTFIYNAALFLKLCHIIETGWSEPALAV